MKRILCIFLLILFWTRPFKSPSPMVVGRNSLKQTYAICACPYHHQHTDCFLNEFNLETDYIKALQRKSPGSFKGQNIAVICLKQAGELDQTIQYVPERARALLALLTWIAVILLGSSLPGCVASRTGLLQNLVSKGEGQECCKLMVNTPCKENLWKNIPGELFSLPAQSQLIGWVLITSIITLAPIAKCISHCCSLVSYLQLKFWKIYSENEWELFEIKAKEHTTRLAAINMNSCFEATGPEPFQTPSNEDWQKISFIYSFDSLKQYYSMIHNIMEATESASRRAIRIPLL